MHLVLWIQRANRDLEFAHPQKVWATTGYKKQTDSKSITPHYGTKRLLRLVVRLRGASFEMLLFVGVDTKERNRSIRVSVLVCTSKPTVPNGPSYPPRRHGSFIYYSVFCSGVCQNPEIHWIIKERIIIWRIMAVGRWWLISLTFSFIFVTNRSVDSSAMRHPHPVQICIAVIASVNIRVQWKLRKIWRVERTERW